jgi:hypothetical protein
VQQAGQCGRCRTLHDIYHRRRGFNNGRTDKTVVEAVPLLANICDDDLIASVLNVAIRDAYREENRSPQEKSERMTTPNLST